MNIYLAFFQSEQNHSIPAYKFWEYYIKNGIEETGFQWIESKVDWAEALVYHNDIEKLAAWKSRTWETVVNDVKRLHSQGKIKFFLSYFYPLHIDIQAIKEIQKLGIPCVNFFCDHIREYTKLPKEFTVFDLNWVPEYKAVPMYKQVKRPYLHLPMPMWVHPSHRQLSDNESTDIAFIGSKDIQRQLLFEQILDKGINIKIYGAGWDNSIKNQERISTSGKKDSASIVKNQVDFIAKNGILEWYRKIKQRNFHPSYSHKLISAIYGKPDFDSYIKITKESLITLGVNRYPSFRFPLMKPDSYSRLRDVEAPMLGACYITEYTEGLENMYDLGSEIETYKDVDELAEKINLLKSDRTKRGNLRNNGQKRALEYNSIPRSLILILEYFGKQ